MFQWVSRSFRRFRESSGGLSRVSGGLREAFESHKVSYEFFMTFQEESRDFQRHFKASGISLPFTGCQRASERFRAFSRASEGFKAFQRVLCGSSGALGASGGFHELREVFFKLRVFI